MIVPIGLLPLFLHFSFTGMSINYGFSLEFKDMHFQCYIGIQCESTILPHH
jgi:hypothetical protein